MKRSYLLIVGVVFFLMVLIGSYTTWNYLDPDFTCARCHEIRLTHEKWKSSVHADIACTQCHGTALENGLISLSEKSGMIYKHFTRKQTNEDLFLTESQALNIVNRCASCHQAEHAAWQSGAHSTTYRDIFTDVEHNKMEKPYWDCFRCHGMHYDGTIHDLMVLEGEPDTWFIKDKKQAERPAITCLSCHQVHAPQNKRIPYRELQEDAKSSLLQLTEKPVTALYIRAEKRHLSSDQLYQATIFQKDSLLKVSDDPNTWLCLQCHAPNGRREVHTEDDKTPTGMYEGMSCMDCHKPHSNQVKNEYRNVHIKLK